MSTATFGSPLIVWLGPRRYSFPIGRDVTVGLDSRADIRLDGAGASSLARRWWCCITTASSGSPSIAAKPACTSTACGCRRCSSMTVGRSLSVIQNTGPGWSSSSPPRLRRHRSRRHHLREVRRARGCGPRRHRDAARAAAASHDTSRTGPTGVAAAGSTPTPGGSAETTAAATTRACHADSAAPHYGDPTTRSELPAPPTAQFHRRRQRGRPGQLNRRRQDRPRSLAAAGATAATSAGTGAGLPAACASGQRHARLTGAMQKLPRQRSPGRTRPRRPLSCRSLQKLRPQRPEPRPHEAAPTTALPRPDAPDAPEISDSPAAEPPSPPPALKTVPLEARRVRLSVDGEQVLADLSFTARRGRSPRVIGLSEASTSALVDVLGGTVQPSVGTVDFDGHDVDVR